MRLLVIDDHQLFLDGLGYILPSLGAAVEVEVAGDAVNALACIESGREFDLVLMDLHMPGLGGLPLLRRLRDRGAALPVVVISGETDPGVILDCIDAGALGFIPKSYGAVELLSALRLVLDGGVYVPPGIDQQRALPAGVGSELRGMGITRRQFEVLRLLAKGYSNREIAGTLCVTEHTVKAHIGALFQALGVGSRTQCVRVAEDRGLI